jgi:hypothetical protein
MVMIHVATENIAPKSGNIMSGECNFLDEKNHTLSETPAKSPVSRATKSFPSVVSPDNSLSSCAGSCSVSSSGTEARDVIDEESETRQICKTQHKRDEEDGRHLPEPLLVENPHRFVLFPIQDDDVSLVILLFVEVWLT